MRFLRKNKDSAVFKDENGEFRAYFDENNKITHVDNIDLTKIYVSYWNTNFTDEQKNDYSIANIQFNFDKFIKKETNKLNKPIKRRKVNRWFNELNEEDRALVLNKVKQNAERLLLEFIRKNQKSALVMNGYYDSLLQRIRNDEMSIRVMDENTCQLIPYYNYSTKGLDGSLSRFVKLISFLYPSGPKKGQVSI